MSRPGIHNDVDEIFREAGIAADKVSKSRDL